MLAPWRPADDPTPPPAGRSSSTSRAAAAVTHVTLDGHPVDQLPPATELGGLPTYAKTSELALPDELGWTKGEDLPDLADAGTGDVRAVMLRMSGRNAYHPVLYRPQAEHAWVEVPEVVVAGPGDGRDGPPALSSAWFSPDRARVAFPQSDGAVVLDVTTGATEQVSTSEEITDLGWLQDGTLVLLGERAWRVFGMVGDEEPRRADGKVSTRPVELVAVQGRPFERIDYDGDGRQSARTALPMAIGGTYGPTVSSSGGWSAVSVFLGPGLEQRLPAYQGVYAVQGDATPRPRLLTTPLEDTTSKAGLRPLGWGPQDTLVLLSLSSEGARVLAWDVVGGAVTRVGRLVGTPPPGDDTEVGEALPMLAL